MARPLWTATISFGLLNIPVRLMTGQRESGLQFHMLDSRDNAPIHYRRLNAATGKEVRAASKPRKKAAARSRGDQDSTRDALAQVGVMRVEQ